MPCLGIAYSIDPCSTVHIATLVIIARKWKQPKCLATDEWTCLMFTVKYSAVKYVHVITVAWVQWVDLEKIRLSEVRQT